MKATKKFKYLGITFILMIMNLISYESIAQYDTEHYIPPFYSRVSANTELGKQYLYLSTNNNVPFDVTVKNTDGTLIDVVTISKSSPAEIEIGWSYGTPGIVKEVQLNMPLVDEGVIAYGAYPFFANMRHFSAAQGMSLTSKGRSALGTRFRTGHMYTAKSNAIDGELKSHMISVMATRDSTEVRFSDISPGVIFAGTNVTGNTSDEISVMLNKYETYIIAAHIDEPLATGNDTLINGMLIESNLPIAVNTGSWCGGADLANLTASRDIGVDQIVPTTALGNEHIIVKRYSYNEEQCERVMIIADEDNTEVFVNGSSSPVAILNSGDVEILPAAMFDANDIMYVTSSQPVYVYQSTNSSDIASLAQGFNFIPPIRCSGLKSISVPIVDAYDGAPADIDVIAPVGSSVFINGAPIGSAGNVDVVTGNPNWQVYKLSNMTGNINVTSDAHVNVSMRSHSGARGYAGFFSGFNDYRNIPHILAFSDLNDGRIAEGCVRGRIAVKKPVHLLEEDVTYNLQIGGSAQMGVDYQAFSSSVFIPAGTAMGVIIVDPIVDGIKELDEDITITLSSSDMCGPILIEKSLIINADTEIEFDINPEAQCLPFTAEFTDHSIVSPGAIYHWNFGDGNTSNEINPIHVYTTEGNFNVSLVIETKSGCLDTLVLEKTDLVNTEFKPVAGFSVDVTETDICNSVINFTNESSGGTHYRYFFDDSTAFSNEENPTYMYQTDGSHFPMQVVSTERGCSDTARAQIFIEPFTLFAPNSFTANGDEFNNTFKPVVGLEVYDWDFKVFDRWGQQVFQTQNIEIGWDGSLPNGFRAPSGSYLWTLTYVSCEPQNPPHQMNGHINLLR